MKEMKTIINCLYYYHVVVGGTERIHGVRIQLIFTQDIEANTVAMTMEKMIHSFRLHFWMDFYACYVIFLLRSFACYFCLLYLPFIRKEGCTITV